MHKLFIGLNRTNVDSKFTSEIIESINASRPGLVLVDNDKSAAEILDYVSKSGLGDRINYIDMGSKEYPPAINILSGADKGEVINTLITMMKNMYDPHDQGIIGPRFEQAVRMCGLTVLHNNPHTIVELTNCFTSPAYGKRLSENLNDPAIKDYWKNQISQISDFHRSEVFDYIWSKFTLFISDENIRAITCQLDNILNMSEDWKQGKTVIVDITKLNYDLTIQKLLNTIVIMNFVRAVGQLDQNSRKPNLYVESIDNDMVVTLEKVLEKNIFNKVNLSFGCEYPALHSQKFRERIVRFDEFVIFSVAYQDAKWISENINSIEADRILQQNDEEFILIKKEENGGRLINSNLTFSENVQDISSKISKIEELRSKFYSGRKTRVEVLAEIQNRMETMFAEPTTA